MVHAAKVSSHLKKSKRSRKEESSPSSSSSSSSGSSSEESPPRRQEKLRQSRDRRRRRSENESPPAASKNLTKEKEELSPARRKKSSGEERRRENYTRGSFSSRREDMPKHRRDSPHEEPRQYKLNRNDSPNHARDSRRVREEPSERSGKRKDVTRKEKKDERKREHDSQPVKIKKEEDFDKKQEELRRKRKRENDREARRHDERSTNVRVKREPRSEDESRQRRQDRQGDGARPRRRDDIERERRENDARRAEAWQARAQEGGQNAEALIQDEEEPQEKEKPNLGLSGALTEDTNTYRGVVIKYSEPPEARIPTKKWRLYPFKGDEALKVLHLHRQSAYLLGKLRRIADIPIDHPSCSKQHAVVQFRMVEAERADGTKKRVIKPYIIDLDSSNGTYVNNNKIEPRRYVELKEKDVVKFAYSSREYVLIHDKSDTTGVETSSSGSESEED